MSQIATGGSKMVGSTAGAVIACSILLLLRLGVRRWKRNSKTADRATVSSEHETMLYRPAAEAEALRFETGVAPVLSASTANTATPVKQRPAHGSQAGSWAHDRINASVSMPPSSVTVAPADVDHHDGATPVLYWDEDDLAFIETSAAEQDDVRVAVEPLTPFDENPIDGGHPHGLAPSQVETVAPPAIIPDLALSKLSSETRSRTHATPSESAPTDPPDTQPSFPEPPGDGAGNAATGAAPVPDVPTTRAKERETIDRALRAETPSHYGNTPALTQYELDLDAVPEAPYLEDDLVGGFDDIEIETEDKLKIPEGLPDLWDVESDDEEADAPLYDVDVGGARLSEYDKAKRLAGQTAKRFYAYSDELWPVLLDIFQESPWPITQRSIERLLTAGVSYQALALAAEIRRIWRNHTEFGQSLPSFNARGESWMYTQEAMSQLSWPRAARLADAWPSYPDEAEVERFLEELFDRWHSDSRAQRSFTSFQLYLGYATGYLDGTLHEWPEFSFETDEALEDSFDELEASSMWSATCEALRSYGIQRPMASRPVYIYSKTIDENIKNRKSKKDETV